MTYEHTLTGAVLLREEVTEEQVRDAVKPLLEYFSTDLETRPDLNGRVQFEFRNHVLEVNTYGEVGWSFIDMLKEMATNLDALAAECNHFTLTDYSTADVENAALYVCVGPTEQARKRYTLENGAQMALEKVAEFFDQEVVDQVQSVLQTAISRHYTPNDEQN